MSPDECWSPAWPQTSTSFADPPAPPAGACSRIAPTPSGLLHLGNAVNFVLTWAMVRAAGGTLGLRIDDADRGRCRPEFVADIFRQLDWLGLDWDRGPSGPDDFFRNHSCGLRIDRYRSLLAVLEASGAVYPCSCSRRRILEETGGGVYPGLCRGGPRPGGGPFALRVRVEHGATVEVDGVAVPLARRMGDFVVWRKDGLPAYQLASLADDIDAGVDLLVRGADLLDSSAAQLYLAGLLGEEGRGFRAAVFHHHPLLTGPAGEKLSKSRGALTLAAMRAAGAGPEAALRPAARLLGLPEEAASSPRDLAQALREKWA